MGITTIDISLNTYGQRYKRKTTKKNHEKRNESEKNRFQGVLSVKIFYRREKK